MGFFIFTAILVLTGAVTTVFGFKASKAQKSRPAKTTKDRYGTTVDVDEMPLAIVAWLGVAVLVLGIAMMIPRTFYTQDAGEAKVQVSWSGELVGQTTATGVHFKAPWVDIRTFDVRNNIVAYVGKTDQDGNLPNYSGNATTGPQITFQDREGVTGNLDLTVRYSLQGDKVLDIYTEFQTQDAFVSKVISETVRSEARKATASRTTIEVYNDRTGLSLEIQKALELALEGQGVAIESVNLQEIRYSADVVARFDEAQAARIAIDRAKAEKETAKVNAETLVVKSQGEADAKVVSATGEAEANRILTESLTPEVLQQRYIDALKSGTVFVVPDGSTPLVTTGK